MQQRLARGEEAALGELYDRHSAVAFSLARAIVRDVSDEVRLQADRVRYERDRKKDVHLGGTHGIDEVMKSEKLDALLFPGVSGSALAAKPGYPTVTVPFAFVPNTPFGGGAAFPESFKAKPAPYGVSFTGGACSEPKLIELAYAFEQATKKRVPPPLFP